MTSETPLARNGGIARALKYSREEVRKFARDSYESRFGPRDLWADVDKTEPAGCWPFTRTKIYSGYGLYRVNGTRKMAHRYAWELVNGPIPAGMCVLHSCDNPPCCNPDHLFLGTHAENMADMVRKGRSTRGRVYAK